MKPSLEHDRQIANPFLFPKADIFNPGQWHPNRYPNKVIHSGIVITFFPQIQTIRFKFNSSDMPQGKLPSLGCNLLFYNVVSCLLMWNRCYGSGYSTEWYEIRIQTPEKEWSGMQRNRSPNGLNRRQMVGITWILKICPIKFPKLSQIFKLL